MTIIDVMLICICFEVVGSVFIVDISSSQLKHLYEVSTKGRDDFKMTESDESQKILTVLSWNVKGFNRKRSKVLHQLSLLNADVVFLQETHVGPDTIYSTGSIKIESLQGDYAMAAFTVFKGRARGVAVLFKKNLDLGGFTVDGDSKGRYIIISCQIWGNDFVFINVYNSNEEKIKYTEFTYLSTQIPPSAFLIIGGDFNTVMDSDLDRTSNIRNRSHRKSFDALGKFLETFNLVDVWRCVYPEVKRFTFFDVKGQSRLDYLFLQSHKLGNVTACSIHERPQYLDKEHYISDHAPISIQIQTNGPKWQLDTLFLKDKTCMERLSCIIKSISGINTKRKGDLWPGVKIRLLCEASALQKERSRYSERMQTSDFLNEMEYMEQEGFEVSEPHTEAHHTPNLQNFLDHLHQTERFEDRKSTLSTVLTEPLSRKEILVVILSLPDCLTPDGLTVYFYKHYASIIVDLLQAFFNKILDLKPNKCTVHDESISQNICDHTYSNNIQYHCRPVTVMDVDYKILATVLAERLSGVIEHILNPGEGKPHISVQECISAIQREAADKIQMLIVSLRVDAGSLKWSYLFYSLRFVKLPETFISALKLLLTQRDANMQHTKTSSVHSQLQGLNMGCPLTPLLISICLLPLIHSVNCEKRHFGPEIQGGNPQSIIEKDKAIIFLSNTNEALDSFEKMLQDFTETSGFIIDERQSEVFTADPSKFSLGKD
ncbi:LINE-1 retrotransposable element ORF2 protein [Misgurnus anguillicaudatus]|uniref:LINE-1 retrotransposable element ORF2 protein n=1 Tax=Misgurnus anguillicaudatus TaxID=75329 RepID=UPI003CCFCC4D